MRAHPLGPRRGDHRRGDRRRAPLRADAHPLRRQAHRRLADRGSVAPHLLSTLRRPVRILFLTRSFNSLTQRLYLELTALGHEVAVEFDISDAVTIEAVALFRPALVVAPFLKRAIPEAVWRQTVCLVVHPGIVGDRGPSALDWAISEGEPNGASRCCRPKAEMDAGPVWAAETFAMREATQVEPVPQRGHRGRGARRGGRGAALRRDRRSRRPPTPRQRRGRWRPLMQQADRRIDWQRDDTQTVLRKIRAGRWRARRARRVVRHAVPPVRCAPRAAGRRRPAGPA